MTSTKMGVPLLAFAVILAVLIIGWVLWKSSHRVPFTPQQASLLRSQLVTQFCDPTPRSMDQGLDSVRDKQSNSYLRQVMVDVRNSIDQGNDVSDSLAKHPEVFNQHYVDVIRQGEMAIRKSGNREAGRKIIAQLANKN